MKIALTKNDYKGSSNTSINWWPGNLRPFESPLSIAARFCVLNGISLAQYESFMGVRLGNEKNLSEADVIRISKLLNEDFSNVQSVFFQTISLSNCGNYNLPHVGHQSNRIRYCKRCLELGYHSYLHEIYWLTRCPFHFHPLEEVNTYSSNGAINARRVDGLIRLMLSHCRGWPRHNEGDDSASQFASNVYVKLLSSWAGNVRKQAIDFSQGEIWSSNVDSFFEEKSYRHAMGRLRKLEDIPSIIVPLFTAVGGAWRIETLKFHSEVKAELHRLNQYTSFSLVYKFFKYVGAISSDPPSFILKMRDSQRELKDKHGICRCHWGREELGWTYHWVKTHPDGWPYWRYKCPYDIALEELELDWGNPGRVLSNRKYYEWMLLFIQLSHVMHYAGLIEYLPNANVSPEGYLLAYPQIWPCCEWKMTSPLTELLNAIAEYEIDSAVTELNNWLDEAASRRKEDRSIAIP